MSIALVVPHVLLRIGESLRPGLFDAGEVGARPRLGFRDAPADEDAITPASVLDHNPAGANYSGSLRGRPKRGDRTGRYHQRQKGRVQLHQSEVSLQLL